MRQKKNLDSASTLEETSLASNTSEEGTGGPVICPQFTHRITAINMYNALLEGDIDGAMLLVAFDERDFIEPILRDIAASMHSYEIDDMDDISTDVERWRVEITRIDDLGDEIQDRVYVAEERGKWWVTTVFQK